MNLIKTKKAKTFNLIDLQKKQRFLINRYEDADLKSFLNKFLGFFVHRGRRSNAIKIFDYFFFNLKKFSKLNPFKIMLKIIKNLMPFLVTGLKTYKGRTYYVPIMVKGNKKNVLLIDWLVRLFKNYSNTWGIKREDVLKSLIDTFYYKGIAMNIKREQYSKALESKHNLQRRYYHKYLIKLFLKQKSKIIDKKYIKKNFKLLNEGRKWKWKLFYLKKRKDVLNWKLYYYRQRNLSRGINYKRLLIR